MKFLQLTLNLLTRRTPTLLAAVALTLLTCSQVRAQPATGSVGEQHNYYLACLLRQAPDLNPLQALVEQCGFDPGEPTKDFVARYTEVTPKDLLAPLTSSIAPYRGEFTDAQYAYVVAIERVLSTQTPDQAAASLATLEARAMQQLGREAADLTILGGLSTARYSLDFWTKGDGSGQPSAKKAKWWQVVLGDVAGGIVGGIFGGAVGAVGLGAACSQAVASL